MDLGFTGFKKDYPDTLVIMPKKKPKGKELTDDAKAWNKSEYYAENDLAYNLTELV